MNPKDKAKATGDTHLPEVEQEPPQAREQRRQQDEATPGRGENQAGFIKDRDNPTSDSYGNTRDSGEGR
jgi:hypothetical protein